MANDRGEPEQLNEPTSQGGRGGAVYTTIDQILSSASNALLLFALARVATPAEFGIAALLIGIVSTWTGFNRGALGTPILLVSNLKRDLINAESGYAVTWATLSGVVTSAAVLVVGFWTGEPAMGIAFALVIPGVFAQDVLRFTAIARGQAKYALVADGLWTVVVLALFIAGALGISVHLYVSVLIWGAAGIASGALLAVLSSVRPHFARLLGWWRTYAPARAGFGATQALNAASATLVTLAVTTLIGAADAGGLRGATTLFGPIAMLISALPLVFVPHARRSQSTPLEQWQLLTKTSMITSSTTLVGTVALTLLPTSVGTLLLGAVWAPAVAVVPYMGASAAAGCWMMGIYALFQALGLSRTSFRMRMLQIVLQVAACVVAALMFGTTAAVAMSLAASSAASVAIGILLVRRLLRDSTDSRHVELPDEAAPSPRP